MCENTLHQNGALTIEDSIGTGVIQGSGTVTDNGGFGGAIWMSSDSNNALTLAGGTIRGFTAKYGAGVYGQRYIPNDPWRDSELQCNRRQS